MATPTRKKPESPDTTDTPTTDPALSELESPPPPGVGVGLEDAVASLLKAGVSGSVPVPTGDWKVVICGRVAVMVDERVGEVVKVSGREVVDSADDVKSELELLATVPAVGEEVSVISVAVRVECVLGTAPATPLQIE